MNDIIKNKKKRKILTIVLSFVLVAAVAIGGALAYLFSQTETKENVFTFAENIKGLLEEPSWDPEDATKLVPGKKIDKDPQITNTSNNAVVEYGAIRLTFTDGAGNELSAADTATLLSLIEIDWSGNWTLVDGTATDPKQIYVFNDTLPQGVTSDPVFYSVTIKESITPTQLKWLAGDYGHTDDCYTFGAHDPAVCTITYRHFEKCAVYGDAEAAETPKGGTTTVSGKTCDCNAVEVHESDCPSLTGTLLLDIDDADADGDTTEPLCGHTTLLSGIGNFIIKVEGAVVQADAFDALFAPATPVAGETYAADALITLFP